MKKIWLVALACLLVLTMAACGVTVHSEVGSFSYTEDCENWGLDNHHAFVNTTPQEANTPEQVIELAKNESKVRYNTIEVAYDETAEMWRVHFSDSRWDFGGDQLVYIDKNGLTQMIVLGK